MKWKEKKKKKKVRKNRRHVWYVLMGVGVYRRNILSSHLTLIYTFLCDFISIWNSFDIFNFLLFFSLMFMSNPVRIQTAIFQYISLIRISYWVRKIDFFSQLLPLRVNLNMLICNVSEEFHCNWNIFLIKTTPYENNRKTI